MDHAEGRPGPSGVGPGAPPAVGPLSGGAHVLATVAWLVTRAADDPDALDETLLAS